MWAWPVGCGGSAKLVSVNRVVAQLGTHFWIRFERVGVTEKLVEYRELLIRPRRLIVQVDRKVLPFKARRVYAQLYKRADQLNVAIRSRTGSVGTLPPASNLATGDWVMPAARAISLWFQPRCSRS